MPQLRHGLPAPPRRHSTCTQRCSAPRRVPASPRSGTTRTPSFREGDSNRTNWNLPDSLPTRDWVTRCLRGSLCRRSVGRGHTAPRHHLALPLVGTTPPHGGTTPPPAHNPSARHRRTCPRTGTGPRVWIVLRHHLALRRCGIPLPPAGTTSPIGQGPAVRPRRFCTCSQGRPAPWDVPDPLPAESTPLPGQSLAGCCHHRIGIWIRVRTVPAYLPDPPPGDTTPPPRQGSPRCLGPLRTFSRAGTAPRPRPVLRGRGCRRPPVTSVPAVP